MIASPSSPVTGSSEVPECIPVDLREGRVSLVVLGLDLGARLGWCVLDGDELCGQGVARLGVRLGARGGQHHDRALVARDLRNVVRAMLGSRVPHVVAYEKVRRHAGVDAARVYGALEVALLEVVATMARPPRVVEVAVSEAKRSLAGKGNADKAAMVAAAEKLYPGRGWSEDAADALAVAMVGGRA